MFNKKALAALLLSCSPVLLSCSGGDDIFPPVPTSTDPATLEMPNPIAVVADPANGQIISINSNLDFFFNQGSITTIDVDATVPDAPVLTATSVTTTPSFAGNVAFDGASLYVPFRESPDEDSDDDQVRRYTVAQGALSGEIQGSTGVDPFGIALSGGTLLVVSNAELNILDADLTSTATVDLTAAADAGIDDTRSSTAESVAVDTNGNRAFISNRGGRIFVVDLDNNTLTHVIDGPESTRGIAFDGTFIYVVEGNPPALWVLDPSQLSDPASAPEEVDDSALAVATVDLALNPNGIAVDAANSRAYVANTGDQSVSVIDLITFSEIARISTDEDDTGLDDGKDPFGLAAGTFDGVPLVFIANISSNNLLILNATTLELVGTFP